MVKGKLLTEFIFNKINYVIIVNVVKLLGLLIYKVTEITFLEQKFLFFEKYDRFSQKRSFWPEISVFFHLDLNSVHDGSPNINLTLPF